ncbi:MAG: hypothetical protein V2I37_05440 [Marinilabiliaceae bacterium]|nr:hypothetical protein [Marinilabiliaceae bacterium]
MSESEMQMQINEINRKLDLIIEDRAVQKQNQDAVIDLVDDLSIVGKDAFSSMVDGLDNAGIELDGDSIKYLVMGFIRNIENINTLMMTLENVMDLVKDAGPIIKEVGIDAVEKFKEIDDRGYFELLKQFTKAIDNVMSKFTREDIEGLGEKIESVLNTLLVIIDPAFMSKIEMFVQTYKDIDHENIPSYSIWKVAREFNKPDMKKSIGFIMTFLKEINAKELGLKN